MSQWVVRAALIQTGFFFFVAAPVALLSGRIFTALGQDVRVSGLAHMVVLVGAFGWWPSWLGQILIQSLNIQAVVMHGPFLALFLTATLFVSVALLAPLRLLGLAVALSLSGVTLLASMLFLVWFLGREVPQKSWQSWKGVLIHLWRPRNQDWARITHWPSLIAMLRLALPASFAFCGSALVYQACVPIAGALGVQTLAAHAAFSSILLALFRLLVAPLTEIAVVLVAQNTGAGSSRDAVVVAFMMCVGAFIVFGLQGALCYVFRERLSALLIKDQAVRAIMVNEIIPVAAVFQGLDGLRHVAQAVLRAQGRQRTFFFVMSTCSVISVGASWYLALGPASAPLVQGSVRGVWLGQGIGASLSR